MAKSKSRVILGDCVCPICKEPAQLRRNVSEHLYIYCRTPAEGGCGIGCTSRYDKGDELLAAYCKKWFKSDDRQTYLAAIPQDPEGTDPVGLQPNDVLETVYYEEDNDDGED